MKRNVHNENTNEQCTETVSNVHTNVKSLNSVVLSARCEGQSRSRQRKVAHCAEEHEGRSVSIQN